MDAYTQHLLNDVAKEALETRALALAVLDRLRAKGAFTNSDVELVLKKQEELLLDYSKKTLEARGGLLLPPGARS